jgi:hypothetical protein
VTLIAAVSAGAVVAARRPVRQETSEEAVLLCSLPVWIYAFSWHRFRPRTVNPDSDAGYGHRQQLRQCAHCVIQHSTLLLLTGVSAKRVK